MDLAVREDSTSAQTTSAPVSSRVEIALRDLQMCTHRIMVKVRVWFRVMVTVR